MMKHRAETGKSQTDHCQKITPPLMQAPPIRAVRVQQTRRATRREQLPVHLSAGQALVAMLSPWLYGTCLRAVASTSVDTQIFFALGGPFLLCLWLGWYLRYRRAGAAAGAWLMLGISLGNATNPQPGEVAAWLLPCDGFSLAVWVVAGALLSIAGALLGQCLHGRPTRLHDDGDR